MITTTSSLLAENLSCFASEELVYFFERYQYSQSTYHRTSTRKYATPHFACTLRILRTACVNRPLQKFSRSSKTFEFTRESRFSSSKNPHMYVELHPRLYVYKAWIPTQHLQKELRAFKPKRRDWNSSVFFINIELRHPSSIHMKLIE